MKGRTLTWDQLQQLNQKQTVAIVSYKSKNLDFTRIFAGGFADRQTAWNWVIQNNLKPGVRYNGDQSATRIGVRLLRLSKVIRELSETKPKNIAAWAVK